MKRNLRSLQRSYFNRGPKAQTSTPKRISTSPVKKSLLLNLPKKKKKAISITYSLLPLEQPKLLVYMQFLVQKLHIEINIPLIFLGLYR